MVDLISILACHKYPICKKRMIESIDFLIHFFTSFELVEDPKSLINNSSNLVVTLSSTIEPIKVPSKSYKLKLIF